MERIDVRDTKHGKEVMPTEQTALTNTPELPPGLRPGGSAPAAPAGKGKARKKPGWLVTVVVVMGIVAIGAAGGWYWWQQQLNALPAGISKANGRLETEQVEIASKYGGRIAAIFAKEGDMVKAGTILARIDTSQLEAQLQAAEAQVRQAESQTVEAEKVIAQRDADRIFAAQELQRTIVLNRDGWATNEQLDQRRDQMQTAQAAYELAVAAVDAAHALIASWQGEARSIKSQVDDDTLVAPVSGRIQYKLAQLGEVLSPGGRVFTLLDFSDVYMTIFVPSDVAGRLTLGDEARVTLDPDPGYVFPAKVSFVATEAQFTPKTVETEEEREKLMFRVKLSAPSQLLARYAEQIKTGVRGIGYLRTDRTVAWPAKLAVKLP